MIRSLRILPPSLVLATTLMASSLFSLTAAAETINDHALWNTKSDPSETRWIQIREFSRMGNDDIFHVDVYVRENGDVKELALRLADHIAIEREALLNSIGQPVDMGVPEREAYQNGLMQWMKTPASQRDVCRRPIQRCMQNLVSEADGF